MASVRLTSTPSEPTGALLSTVSAFAESQGERSIANTKTACCAGHEIVGKAVRVGRNAKHVKVGDRVGVGPQSRACFRAGCTECSSGRSSYCPRAVTTYNGKHPGGVGRSQGGFSNYNRTPGSFVFKIPDGLASEDAAPMLCAGSTVYAPLKRYGCGPGKRIGVVGIGGLGHFALLFAKALGADEVVAISRGSAKKADALELGADRYVATGEDEDWVNKMDRSLDLLVITGSSADMPVNKYMAVLKSGGTLLHLGYESCSPSLANVPTDNRTLLAVLTPVTNTHRSASRRSFLRGSTLLAPSADRQARCRRC